MSETATADPQQDQQNQNGEAANQSNQADAKPQTDMKARLQTMKAKEQAMLQGEDPSSISGQAVQDSGETGQDDDSEGTDAPSPLSAPDQNEQTPQTEPDDQQDSQAGGEASDETDGESSTAATPSGEDDTYPDLDTAKAALKRAGFDDDILEALSEDRIREKGASRIKRENDQQAEYNRKQELEKLLGELGYETQRNPGDDDQTQAGSDGSRTEKGDTDTGTEDHKAKIKQAFYDDIEQSLSGLEKDEMLGDAKQPISVSLTSMADRLVDQVVDQYDNKIGAYEKALDDLKSQVQTQWAKIDDSYMRNAARDLGDQYPELKDNDTFEKVKERAYKLAKSDEDRSLYFDDNGNPKWSELMGDSASIELGKRDGTKQAQAQLANKQRKAQSGQPETNGKPKPNSSQKMSTRDIMNTKEQMLRQGYTLDEVEKWGRSVEATD